MSDVANLELNRLGVPVKDIKICFDEVSTVIQTPLLLLSSRWCRFIRGTVREKLILGDFVLVECMG